MNDRIKVKICGLTNVDDAEMAVAAGADFVGLVFVESSSRMIDLNDAKKVVDTIGNTASKVGVFQNQEIDYVNGVALQLNLDFVQLHGHESVSFMDNCMRPVIKVFQYTTNYYAFANHVHGISKDDLLSAASARYLLLDLEKRSTQSTGVVEQLECLTRIAEYIAPIRERIPPLFLAGGLSNSNVEAACKIMNPYAVDVASGVEYTPGKKSTHLTSSFCEIFKTSAFAWRSS